ncbi:lysophospholipase-like protein 1 isoform X2 [Littorina saxatilis]|uniref:palmitoyl-protein hydrolase n=1 Tax=Littorina saxatilis TaxID=31220 RepID=A0AAN9GEC8_9CAEN
MHSLPYSSSWFKYESTGERLRNSIKTALGEELTFSHIRILYPTAPLRAYTQANGEPSHVWFDRLTISLAGTDHEESVDTMATKLGQLIDAEVKSGIPLHRIVIGGYSMGGTMALHLGYRFYPQVTGVLVMGNFLYSDSCLYTALEKRDTSSIRLPPLKMFHAEQDQIVPLTWGKVTFNKLTSLGVKGDFVILSNQGHSMNTPLADSARNWIANILPRE